MHELFGLILSQLSWRQAHRDSKKCQVESQSGESDNNVMPSVHTSDLTIFLSVGISKGFSSFTLPWWRVNGPPKPLRKKWGYDPFARGQTFRQAFVHWIASSASGGWKPAFVLLAFGKNWIKPEHCVENESGDSCWAGRSSGARQVFQAVDGWDSWQLISRISGSPLVSCNSAIVAFAGRGSKIMLLTWKKQAADSIHDFTKTSPSCLGSFQRSVWDTACLGAWGLRQLYKASSTFPKLSSLSAGIKPFALLLMHSSLFAPDRRQRQINALRLRHQFGHNFDTDLEFDQFFSVKNFNSPCPRKLPTASKLQLVVFLFHPVSLNEWINAFCFELLNLLNSHVQSIRISFVIAQMLISMLLQTVGLGCAILKPWHERVVEEEEVVVVAGAIWRSWAGHQTFWFLGVS